VHLGQYRKVVNTPGRIKPVDANNDFPLAERAFPKRRQDLIAGHLLVRRGDGIFQIQNDDVRGKPACLFLGTGIVTWHKQNRSARARYHCGLWLDVDFEAGVETRLELKSNVTTGSHDLMMSAHYPERIVCLTEETTETLYLLGEEGRIVGISGYTVRPSKARKEKPRISAFTSAKIERILDLAPDLVLGFSDLQAEIAADLIGRGITVLVFNHRSVDGILKMIRTLGGMVGAGKRADQLATGYEDRILECRRQTARRARRPRVYFEEWDEPQISAIRWVSELISIAGGEDIFPELAACADGKSRIIADPSEVIRRAPDIIIGSWCGKKFRSEKVAARPGWDVIPAVSTGALHEIKSAEILQPGPAALSTGLDHLLRIVGQWQNQLSG